MAAVPSQGTGAVTIRHLLTHTSGLIDYEDVIPETIKAQLHDADVLRLLESQDRTYFRPGSDYRYSNSGYALLALIVERASAERSRPSCASASSSRSGMTQHGRPRRRHLDGQQPRLRPHAGARRWTRTDQSPTSAVLGDGGIYSSIDDLAKWDAALYDGRLLRPKSLQAAFTPGNPDRRSRRGIRLRLAHHRRDAVALRRDVGFRNVIVRYPKRRLTVVVLTNRNDPEPYPLALRYREKGYRFSIALIARDASNPNARAMCRNSMTSMRRSPPSYFATKLWCLPSLSASCCWVNPLSRGH